MDRASPQRDHRSDTDGSVGVLGLIVSMVMISTAHRREVVTCDRVIERDAI
jgi:hypothetical protein